MSHLNLPLDYHALHADNTRVDRGNPAIAVLSIGYQPLGSCSRAAGWSAATLCLGTNRTTSDVRLSPLLGAERKLDFGDAKAVVVKVCGCRPDDGGAADAGPAYANLQGRKPREFGGGGASEAMGISSPAVCCRSAVSGCLGRDRGGDEPVQPIAIGRTRVADRRSSDKTAVHDGTAASMFMAV